MEIKNKEFFTKNWPFEIAYKILNRDKKICLEHNIEVDISIDERFKFVFSEYLKELDEKKIKYSSEIKYEINSNLKLITNAVNKYLSGDLRGALHYAEKVLDKLKEKIIDIDAETYFFRARATSAYHVLDREKMFHIPFDKRYLIGNQRYSMSGIPCLYLGQSTYICWEELGRPNPYSCNFIGVKSMDSFKVLDMTLFSRNEGNMLSVIPIIISCCLFSQRRNSIFKQEYVLPQLIMQMLIIQNKNVIGIKYHSSHLFYSAFPFVSDSCTLESDIYKHNNYVFPALRTDDESQFSKALLDLFHTTETFSIWQEQLISSKEYVPIPLDKSELDVFVNYLDNSIFGQLDKIFVQNEFALLLSEIHKAFSTKLSKMGLFFSNDGEFGEMPRQ